MTSKIKVNILADGGDNAILTSNGSGTVTINNAALKNTPNCLVYLSGSQTISDDTITKITFDTEVYDSDSAFASNKFTVPSGAAGKYAIFLNLSLDTGADSNMNYAYGYIYKNGSSIRQAGIDLRANPGRRNFVSVFSVEDLSASDYIEAYAIIDDTSGSPLVTGGSSNSLFMIYKLIE
jgi:hypothetical protein